MGSTVPAHIASTDGKRFKDSALVWKPVLSSLLRHSYNFVLFRSGTPVKNILIQKEQNETAETIMTLIVMIDQQSWHWSCSTAHRHTSKNSTNLVLRSTWRQNLCHYWGSRSVFIEQKLSHVRQTLSFFNNWYSWQNYRLRCHNFIEPTTVISNLRYLSGILHFRPEITGIHE